MRIYFEDSVDRTHTLIEGWGFLGRGITTRPKTQVVIIFLSNHSKDRNLAGCNFYNKVSHESSRLVYGGYHAYLAPLQKKH